MDVLYEDERIIVVDKPHFLATMPRGMWYRETALIRLRERLGEPDITPAHRLDRMTAGVLVFVRDPACRGAYQMLFQNKQATKVYECLASCAPIRRPRFGTITQAEPPRPFPLLRRSHITKERGTLAAFEEPGAVNAETLIERGELILPSAGGRWREAPEGGPHPGNHPICRYTLHPRTGKTHHPSESLSPSTGHPAHCIVVHHHDALAIAIDEFLRTNARDNVVSGLHCAVECLRQPIHQGVES